MKKRIFILWFVFWAGWLQGQQVVVSGHVEGFSPGTLIRVQVYADQFSRLEKTLAATRTDLSGNFRMTFQLKRTTFALLAVNLQKSSFFLTPGGVYRFEVKKDTVTPSPTPFDQTALRVSLQAEDDSLNARIDAYEQMFDRFVRWHFRDIYQYHKRQVFEDFKTRVMHRFQGVKSAYLRQYIRYALASVAWGARMGTLPELAQKYFVGQPVLYQNIQYTDFFLDFFQAYFQSTVQKPVSIDRLVRIVPLRDVEKLDALFAQAPVMGRDARVRQLAEMVQLAAYFHDRNFDQKDILFLFDAIARTSVYPENRQVAKNYMKKLKELQPGMPAPDFLLPDVTGKELSLKNFRGKFVLISFVRTRCPVCNFQLQQLKSLQNDLIDFTNLTIVSGKITADFMQKVNPAGQPWPFLLLGNDVLLLEKYQVVTYPAYVLIDPAGRISMAPAPMPGENLEQRLRTVINAFKKRIQN